jgi:hypothetical protein
LGFAQAARRFFGAGVNRLVGGIRRFGCFGQCMATLNGQSGRPIAASTISAWAASRIVMLPQHGGRWLPPYSLPLASYRHARVEGDAVRIVESAARDRRRLGGGV